MSVSIGKLLKSEENLKHHTNFSFNSDWDDSGERLESTFPQKGMLMRAYPLDFSQF